MVLSNNRVKSTNDYIISKGIDQSRIIKYEGFGETQSNYILQTAIIKIWQPKRNNLLKLPPLWDDNFLKLLVRPPFNTFFQIPNTAIPAVFVF